MVADKPTDITIGEVLEMIRTGFWKTPVACVSGKYATTYKTAVDEGNADPAAAAKRASMALKKKLPALTPSGRFEKRCEAGIIEHSGILCLDIDHNLEREKINSSPNVQFSFRSPTGSGLKAGIRIRPDPSTHARSFLAAQKYFKERSKKTEKTKFIRTWQATAVGLEAAAALHSDTLMVVDEIHHVEPKVLDAAAYSLTNGYGKSRGNIYACIRPTARWRVLVLSSGEMSCETRLYSGGLIVRGGQTVRHAGCPSRGEARSI